LHAQSNAADRALVDRLEVLARERPGYYRLRVASLALLGLGYRVVIWAAMFAMPIALTLMFYPTVWTLVIAVVLLVLFGVYWFKPPASEGERLQPADAPELFAALEALRRKTGAPRVHEVFVTGEFNASAAAIPRLGLFGWYKHVLTLGIPLLTALSREQVLAVVGHELGHFSKAHGRFDQWVYRTRHSWDKLQAQLGEEDSGLGAAVSQFYRSFIPYFSAYSFVLGRLCEYEADADSARASDPATAASALAAVHAFGDYYERSFLPALWREAQASPEAPTDLHGRFAQAVRTASPETLEAAKRRALKRTSDLADTHPCLTDRLRALQATEVSVGVPATCGGRAFFGERWDGILERASQQWRTANARAWSDANQELADCVRRLAELPSDRSSIPVRMEVARLTHLLKGPDAALEQWRALRADAPEDVRVGFQLALALARLHDAAAFAEFEAVAERASGYAGAAAAAMKELALDLGDTSGADAYEARRRRALDRSIQAEEALLQGAERGRLEPHRLAPHAVSLLTRQLQADGLVAGAYLAAVQPGEVKEFGAVLLMIRIDPAAMDRAQSDPITIVNRCRILLRRLLEPNEFPWVANFYITEAVDAKIGAALAAMPSSRLFGNLDSPEGTVNDWQ
jgi:Zn-dependent protease with chaperone function